MRALPTRIEGIASYSPQQCSPTVDPGALSNRGVNVSIRRSTNPGTVVVEGNGHSIATMREVQVTAGWPNGFHFGADRKASGLRRSVQGHAGTSTHALEVCRPV